MSLRTKFTISEHQPGQRVVCLLIKQRLTREPWTMKNKLPSIEESFGTQWMMKNKLLSVFGTSFV